MDKYMISGWVFFSVLSSLVVLRTDAMDGMSSSMMDMDMKKNTSGDGMDGMMKMYFHTGEMVTLFFKDWMTMSSTEYNGACAALAILAFFYEGFKILRQWIAMKEKVASKIDPQASFKLRVGLHLLQTLLHMIQIFFGYLLMLAFMTYNTGVCVAIILGFGMGYLAFGWWSPPNDIKLADGECCNM